MYGPRGTNAFNADPFFDKQDVLLGTIAPQFVNPELHKWIAGGTVGGPIVKNKLFFFLGYHHLYTSDQYGALSQFQVPAGLPTNSRSTTDMQPTLATSLRDPLPSLERPKKLRALAQPWAPGTPPSMAVLQAQLPDGQYLIPGADASAVWPLASGLPDASLDRDVDL